MLQGSRVFRREYQAAYQEQHCYIETNGRRAARFGQDAICKLRPASTISFQRLQEDGLSVPKLKSTYWFAPERCPLPVLAGRQPPRFVHPLAMRPFASEGCRRFELLDVGMNELYQTVDTVHVQCGASGHELIVRIQA